MLSIGLLVLLAARIMNFDLRKDEELYVTPARLLNDMSLYRDFFYNHPPASAWYFHAIDILTGSRYLLASGRIGMVMAWMLFAATMIATSFFFTRSLVVSWSISTMTLLNDLLLGQTGMAATNNFIPLGLDYLGLSLFVISIKGPKPKHLLTALSGITLALAVCVKISAIAFIPPVAIASFFLPKTLSQGTRLLGVVAPLVIGGTIGGLPILIALATEHSLFLAHVVRYHSGPHLQFYRNGLGDAGSAIALVDKILLAWQTWFNPSFAVGLSALVALGALAIRSGTNQSQTGKIALKPLLAVVLGAAMASLCLSFLPTPSFPQYFAPPIICLPIALALIFADLPSPEKKPAQTLLVAACVVVLIAVAPRLAQSFEALLHPRQWATITVHEVGVGIADRVAHAHAIGPVATLSPVYPLEGHLKVYPELSTGPFAYRTAGLTPPELAAYYKMTSPTSITALLEREPPAAFLLGSDEPLEAPMLAFARANGYQLVGDFEISDRQGKLKLYVKPGLASP